jgi:hypothetical protein
MATPPNVCSECQEEFSSRNKLFSHIRVVHQGEEPTSKPAITATSAPSAPSSTSTGKSARPGRVARRRNKEGRARRSSQQQQQQGPRLASLEGFCRRNQDEGGGRALTLQDAQTVTDQLGFAPTNLIEVEQCTTLPLLLLLI